MNCFKEQELIIDFCIGHKGHSHRLSHLCLLAASASSEQNCLHFRDEVSSYNYWIVTPHAQTQKGNVVRCILWNSKVFILCTKTEINVNPQSCNFIKIISKLGKEGTEYCFHADDTGQCHFNWKKEIPSFVETSLLRDLEELKLLIKCYQFNFK